MRYHFLVHSLFLCLALYTASAQDLGKYRDSKFIQGSLLKQGILFANNEARLCADSNDVTVPPADSVACDTMPSLVSKTEPVYPHEALDSLVHGTVITMMWVDSTGMVRRVRLVKSDDSIFNASALVASFKWKFRPATLSGRPINIWVTVPFRYAVSK